MVFFKPLFSAFTSGSSAQQSDSQSNHNSSPVYPPPVVDKSTIFVGRSDFSSRLRRARSEPMEIVKCYDNFGSEVDLLNRKSGNVYHVTEYSCECEDFKKTNLPCKHMIFLDLHSGRYMKYEKPIPRYFDSDSSEFIPRYWDYYSGSPTGVGYLNLYPYTVVGRIHGVSEKTGKPTNRKKSALVYAISKDDAILAAQSLGLDSPFSSITNLDLPPSDRQYSYLHGVGIPHPNLITGTDASALLSRYEDSDNSPCPDVLFRMATSARVSVSYFSSANTVINRFWHDSSDVQKCALFCYSVYCRELSFDFGFSPLLYPHEVFSSYSPEQKQMKYILALESIIPHSLSKRSSAYQSAVLHLRRRIPYIFP